MSDYKRLTDEDWLTTIFVNDTNEAKLIEYAFRLWQLETKIKNGTLIELPDMRVIPDNVHGSLIQIVWFDACGEIQFQYFPIKRKAEAELTFEELKKGQK